MFYYTDTPIRKESVECGCVNFITTRGRTQRNRRHRQIAAPPRARHALVALERSLRLARHPILTLAFLLGVALRWLVFMDW